MKTLLMTLLSGFVWARPDCSTVINKIHMEVFKAQICKKDQDCIVTEELTGKLFCGAHLPVNRKANLKKILKCIADLEDCPQGGSCETGGQSKPPYLAKCLNDRCELLSKDE